MDGRISRALASNLVSPAIPRAGEKKRDQAACHPRVPVRTRQAARSMERSWDAPVEHRALVHRGLRIRRPGRSIAVPPHGRSAWTGTPRGTKAEDERLPALVGRWAASIDAAARRGVKKGQLSVDQATGGAREAPWRPGGPGGGIWGASEARSATSSSRSAVRGGSRRADESVLAHRPQSSWCSSSSVSKWVAAAGPGSWQCASSPTSASWWCSAGRTPASSNTSATAAASGRRRVARRDRGVACMGPVARRGT